MIDGHLYNEQVGVLNLQVVRSGFRLWRWIMLVAIVNEMAKTCGCRFKISRYCN